MGTLIPCPGCRVLTPSVGPPTFKQYIGTVEGCWRMYGEILVREYEHYPQMKETHRISVDAYMAQHPGAPSRQSIQSVAVHLISLYCALEKNLTGTDILQVMRRALKSSEHFVWLAPPDFTGSMNVSDIVKANDIQEHQQLVRTWAEEVWGKWREQHSIIRGWSE